MPALSDASPLFQPANARAVLSDGQQEISVICAWPLSGQYGVGSRILYYILVAACVLARKSEWLRNACLAAALIFPAVAALHGITLAALHVDGAVDLDIYGAFQLCSIGILAVPVTTRLSRTYFYDPGRNIIFLWTGIVLAGLLSLTVEFYRSDPVPCVLGDGPFEYGQTSCGLDYCVDGDGGPKSPMRRSATSEIYVIPAPSALTFNAATLSAAACCIPAILYLISTWLKILELNWRSRFGTGDLQQQIEGTNGATVGGMLHINAVVASFLSVLEILLFGAAVVAILIIGELNFFSEQMGWEVELIQSVGQWAPLAGTVLAIIGSLYHLVVADADAVAVEENGADRKECCCNCAHHTPNQPPLYRSPSIFDGSSTHSSGSRHQGMREGFGLGVMTPALHEDSMLHRASTAEDTEGGDKVTLKRTRTIDAASRRRVAEVFNSMANYLGTAAHDRFDDSDFKQGKAVDFPEIPGEAERNSRLGNIREAYNPQRELDGSLTPELRPQRSRASSFNSAFASGAIPELTLGASRPASIDDVRPLAATAARAASRGPVQSKARSSTLPTDKAPRPSSDMDERVRRLSDERGTKKRSNTLEVPVLEYSSHIRNTLKNSSNDVADAAVVSDDRPSTPAIVVSAEPDDVWTATRSFSRESPHTDSP
ncbi:uncharacterized protein B0I36DRAFT_330982 [Microdochium trichocladiopsis]|uniref:Uncharacterized protein n=1 Tax=Microdochium trichocladiopsis TaxID=1682393 RepID=A0A9P8Y0N2_9PEZI|nr:uncharacterized protein B0I36DRAFT_330982 [Microdochium trichocladiopsis]KAH7026597.1 hypothetical protein B0I36DRAFT_330982 [Microdochium trichocladiopsis]